MIRTKLIVATSSTSRINLLKKSKIKFLVAKPKINEETIKKKYAQKNNVKKLTQHLAKQKSISVSKDKKNQYVLGCDTMVLINKKRMDKAKNLKEAKKSLKKLSGKKHKIITSLCLCKNKKVVWEHTETTTVEVRKLNNSEINYYFKQNGKQILKSVGCYQAEKMGPFVFSKINGDFYNVLGLPIIQLFKHLRKYNILQTL